MRAIQRRVHRYGDHASHVAELFLPDGEPPFPGVAVLHGGYWQARFDRSLMDGVCADLAASGLAAWNLEYRRVGEGGGWPETADDVARGVEAVPDAIARERLALLGHSAGAQLAFWACAQTEVAAAVSQAGILDLRLAAETPPADDFVRAFLGGSPREQPDRYAEASPRELVPLRVPQLVLHGDRDRGAPLSVSESYASAARAAGDPCELRMLPDTGHREHLDPRSEAWAVARDWLLERL